METPQGTTSSDVFYNAVAKEYDSHMTENDRRAREIISVEFCRLVKGGNVLDFGGGTGLDLPWLAANNNYKVFFLETSYQMRAVARQNLPSLTGADKIVFAEDNMDFNTWNGQSLPFTKKMDGVLANFAVLNSIQNLHLFFEKMALVCNKDCHVFLTMLDSRLATVFKNYTLGQSAGYLLGKKLAVTNSYNGVNHTTHIHALSTLRHASAGWFNYVSHTPVPFSNFALVVLSKK